jgi:ribonuclease HII
VFGADEAGKGPVLGPMVAAAVGVPDESVLPADVDDSKRLSPERRTELAAAIRADDRVRVGIASVGPDRIDDPETDMNTLTVAVQAKALSAVVTDGENGVVDAGDVDADRFARRVGDRLGTVDPQGEHNADSSYAVVGAASVIAKVERDRRVDAIVEEYGTVGSGYPSDPTTREFLREYVREHDALPGCARASWKTSRDVLAAAEQSALDEF